MNLVQKYVIKEIFPFFIIGNLFFMFLLLMEKMVTLAELFFSKNVPITILIETIIYLLPSIFFMTIPLSGLLATLIAFNRLSADSELIAMKSVGASNTSLIKPLIILGIIAGLLNLSMGLYFVEKGSTLAYNNLNKIIEHISIKDIKPNEMYNKIPGISIYAGKKINDTTFEDMVLIQKNNNSIINSKNATITPTDNKSMEMIFHNGSYTMENQKKEITSMGFSSMTLNFPLNMNIAKAVNSPMTMSVSQLFGFSLGVFLSRSGKSFGILLSIGLAFLYNVLMLFFENSAGQIPISPALSAWIPLLIFIMLLVYSFKRSFK